MRKTFVSPDLIAVVVLILLWLLFFWRLFTPSPADQVSLVEGDFSGQFVAFGAYQYERLAAGEIPLWNPYNNAGLPFIADTQAAAFYPPRLLTIALSSLAGGWSYNALQLEMAFHVLAYTLMMFALVRRLTHDHAGHASIFGGLGAAVIAGYGGFLTGYPPLQLALLEAAIWLPLALLGVLEATRADAFRWPWLAVSGLALGLSWLAGHPQTSWFATYLLVAYLAYRVFRPGSAWVRPRWWYFIAGLGALGLVTAGIFAVQLLPGLEYLARTMRTGLGFDNKGGGFPFQDVAQLLLPGVVSVWSPLYVGLAGLALALIGLTQRARGGLFWGIVALVALGMSFGGRTPLFHALYNLLPGLSFFRGQERAAYLVANSLAILAGLGVVALAGERSERFMRWLWRSLISLAMICAIAAGLIFIAWLGDRDAYGPVIEPVFFTAIVAGLALVVISQYGSTRLPLWGMLLLGVVIFELFSVNMDNDNWEAIPAAERTVLAPPLLVKQVQADDTGPFRVDGGFEGMYGRGNAGSLYGVQELRGISPLFLAGPHAIIQRELPAETAWELFSVRYVFTAAEELPVDSEIVGRDYPHGSSYNLHLLDDPRPFAHLVYRYEVLDSDAFARALLADPAFNPRSTAILNHQPGIILNGEIPDQASAEVIEFAPERFSIQAITSAPAILTVAHVDYPGWQVTVNGEAVEPLRAYGALTALPIEAGEHIITFRYAPLSFVMGALLSLFTWAGVIILGAVRIVRHRRGAE
jgi:hypothetical protein